VAKNRILPSSCLLLAFLVFGVPSRAFAYGDPSGGMLFQILTPLAAMLWGAWLIFAGHVRRRLDKIFGRTELHENEITAVSVQNSEIESTNKNKED